MQLSYLDDATRINVCADVVQQALNELCEKKQEDKRQIQWFVKIIQEDVA